MRILRKIFEIFIQQSWNSKKREPNATFLDLNINVKSPRFQTKSYDKWNNFNFNIIRIPYKSSNIPQKMFYSAMSAEIIRICKAPTKFQIFLKSAETLIHITKAPGKSHGKGSIETI